MSESYQEGDFTKAMKHIVKQEYSMNMEEDQNSARNIETQRARKQSKISVDINNHSRVSVSGIEGLRLLIDTMHGNRNTQKLSEHASVNYTEASLCHSRMNYDIFIRNFTEDMREYAYQTWNHFTSRHRFKLKRRESRSKPKEVVQDEFTKEEKEYKKVLDSLNLDKISRTACLKHQYSPEVCFNSMIDVIDIERVKQPLDHREEDNDTGKAVHIYTPRMFTYPRDSLYIEGEFPPKTSLRTYYLNSVSSLARGRKSKSRDLKKKIHKDNKMIKQKRCFPIVNIINPQDLMIKSMRSKPGHSDDEEHEIGDFKERVFRHMSSLVTSEEDIGYISDLYLHDFVEIDHKHIEHLLEKPDELHPEDLYNGIVDREKNATQIEVLNWSGEQIYPSNIYTKHRTTNVIGSLNFQDTLIWLRGFSGVHQLARKYARFFVESDKVVKFLTICVLLNTVILMLEGLLDEATSSMLDLFNSIFTIIFVLELLIKIFAYEIKGFFKSFMNIFDTAIVIVSLVEISLSISSGEGISSSQKMAAFKALRVLRMFRVLRITRILRSMKFMKVIVAVIVETAEQYTYVAIILLLFIFIYALLGMQIYAGKLIYEDRLPRLNFDTFIPAFFTLFQLLTFENWTDVVEVCYSSTVPKPVTLIYILSWIIIGNFIIFNLFLALLLGGFDSDNVIKSLEETNDEFKELQQAIIIEKETEIIEREKVLCMKAKQLQSVKYILKAPNSDKIENDDGMNDLLEPEEKKKRATYLTIRDVLEDESSLDELLFDAIDDKQKPPPRKKLVDMNREIYEDVYCDTSLFMFTKENKFRRFGAHIASHFLFEPVIMFLIVLSSLKLVIETYFDDEGYSSERVFFDWFDKCINILFIFEFIFKVLRNGFYIDKNSYLRDPWSWLDFIIMTTSILDMLLSNLSIPMIKVFRTLRPLRFVAHYKHMRIIVNSLLGALGPLLNVSLVMMMVWLIFAILGMNFVGGKLWFCDIDDPYGVSKDQCLNAGNTWKRAYWNFDNIAESFVTLYVLVSMEGWPSLVASSVDAGDSATTGPMYNSNPWMLIYFLLFILIGSMFLMDLFTGVIFYQYGVELEKEISMISENCTDDQVKWIMMQKLIFSANSNFELIEKPKNKIRAFFFMVVNSRRFEFVIYISIFLNAIVLSMDYEGMSTDYEIVLIIINDVLIWIFVLEFIFKMIAFSWYYFKDPWNLLDFLIALISVAEFFLTGIGLTPRDHNTTIGKISKAARVIRVVRLFKILKTKHLRAFNKLINTLIFSLPTIANVLALLMMVYFIFAVIGCFVFKNAEVNKEYNNQVLNFNTFHIGLLTLFVCSTGEDWPVVMYNYGDSKGMYIVARVYFMTYILVTTFSMLNLLELVVVQIFESFYFDPDNVLETFDQISTEFNKTWNAFTISTKGKRIKSIQLPRLFAHLKEPLGFRVAEENDPDIEQIISEERQIAIRKPLFSIAILIALNTLPIDDKGYVSYVPVLQLAMKFMFGNRTMQGSDSFNYNYIKKIEAGMIADRLLQDARLENTRVRVSKYKKNQYKFNPVRLIMNMKVALKVWKEYTELWDRFKMRKGVQLSSIEIEQRIEKQRDEELKFYNRGFQGEGSEDKHEVKRFETFRMIYELLLDDRSMKSPDQIVGSPRQLGNNHHRGMRFSDLIKNHVTEDHARHININDRCEVEQFIGSIQGNIHGGHSLKKSPFSAVMGEERVIYSLGQQPTINLEGLTDDPLREKHNYRSEKRSRKNSKNLGSAVKNTPGRDTKVSRNSHFIDANFDSDNYASSRTINGPRSPSIYRNRQKVAMAAKGETAHKHKALFI